MTKIKICGLRRECDIDYVNELKPEYIGYVFWDKSRRYITYEKAAALTEQLDKSIIPVGVFVDADIRQVASLLENGTIRIAQLHGNESEEYVRKLRTYTDKPIIKAFKVAGAEDVKRANQFPSDYILLDNGYGTGESFDWKYVKEAQRPFFLAGGMDAQNVSGVIKNMDPYAVDISSKVETEGYKDYEKIKEFIKAVRNSMKRTSKSAKNAD